MSSNSRSKRTRNSYGSAFVAAMPGRVSRNIGNGSFQTSPTKTGDRRRKRTPYFSAAMMERLRPVAESMTDRRDKALLWMLIESSLRPTELLSISRGQIRVMTVDRHDKSLPAAGSGYVDQLAGDSGHKLTIGPTAIIALRDYMKHDRVAGDGPAIFTEKTGERLTIEALMPLIRRWQRQAKVRPKQS